jgi:hypothetical protein
LNTKGELEEEDDKNGKKERRGSLEKETQSQEKGEERTLKGSGEERKKTGRMMMTKTHEGDKMKWIMKSSFVSQSVVWLGETHLSPFPSSKITPSFRCCNGENSVSKLDTLSIFIVPYADFFAHGNR